MRLGPPGRPGSPPGGIKRFERKTFVFHGGRRLGIEIKRADAPVLTSSMRIALRDLKLDRLVVLYPGTRRYPLADRVTVVPLAALGAPEPEEAVFAAEAPPRRRGGRARRRSK